MATPPPIVQAAANARRLEERERQQRALEASRRKLSWRAIKELRRRLDTAPEQVETRDLVRVATLDQGDRDKSLTLKGDPARPLIIGLAPARDLQPPPDVPQLPPPKPPELVDGNAIIPQRFSLTEVAEALRVRQRAEGAEHGNT